MSGMGFPLFLQLVLLRSKSWVKTLVVVVQLLSCVSALCDPMDCSMPGSPVLHYLLEFAQVHVHWVSFSISPSNEYSGLISFRIDWFDLLAVQVSSPAPQFKSTNSSELSLPYGPTLISIHDYWEDHSFVSKLISLLFNILSRFVIAFFPRNKRLLISWLQSPSVVILEPKKRKSVTASTFSHLFAMKWCNRMPWS